MRGLILPLTMTPRRYKLLFLKGMELFVERNNLRVGKISNAQLSEMMDEVCEGIRVEHKLDKLTHDHYKGVAKELLFGSNQGRKGERN